MNNLIHYKLIEHERTEDAPFMGALISACDCNFNCKNCFNQDIKNIKTKINTIEEIITEIKSNIFNKGIIFAGLEWTLQINEVLYLARKAKDNDLFTILYTGNDFDYFIKHNLYINDFDYIKCGKFIEEQKTINHIEYGVTLASLNQHIYKKEIDY